jgi:hypothetical protein
MRFAEDALCERYYSAPVREPRWGNRCGGCVSLQLRNVSSPFGRGLGKKRCVGELHRQHLWGSLTDGFPGVKGPLRG